MFEPLPTLIRLRRAERNLSQDALAKKAGVSRRQLALFEAGGNVSLKFLIKVARALEMTDLPIAELRVRATHQDLVPIAKAGDILARLKQSAREWATAAEEVDDLSASLDEVLGRALEAGLSSPDIAQSAEHLASTPAAEQNAVGEALYSISRSEPVADAPRPRPADRSAARRQR